MVEVEIGAEEAAAASGSAVAGEDSRVNGVVTLLPDARIGLLTE